MTWRQVVGVLMYAGSCWAMWMTLEAVSDGDSLAGLIGFLVTWAVARSALELTQHSEDGRLSARGQDHG
ncbi:MAG TPA: hypothetical protein DCQ06_13025 [Myxococcales bacterium]|nr:hypothetical protein [Myxococcales bacterium]HAN32512.1 hypothetical protein [Myxococcales bacterium]